MHELGIVFHIIRTVEDVAKENHVARIQRVTLQLGEVSGVVESYLQDCWKWAAAKSEILPGAALTVVFAVNELKKPAEHSVMAVRLKSVQLKLMHGLLQVILRPIQFFLASVKVKPVQPLKATSPIFVTLFGISIEIKPVQNKKARSPISLRN